MKKLFVFLVVTFFLASCSVNFEQNLVSEKNDVVKSTPTLLLVQTEVSTKATDVCSYYQTSEAKLVRFQHSVSGLSFDGYIADSCSYLKKLLDPDNSVLGTIVVPIMIHSISDNCVRTDDGSCVTETEFYSLMNSLVSKGFQAISAESFIDYLYNNSKIPTRSVLLIVDDRRNGVYFEKYFRPYYEKYGWVVINSYISSDSLKQALKENVVLEKEGWVDHQAHGTFHNIPINNWRYDAVISSLPAYKYIDREISYPIKFFEENFGKKPEIFVWPGGGYTKYATGLVEAYGYKAGFTIEQRGPIIFNILPDTRENFQGNPLFVLPRYWSYRAESALSSILTIQDEVIAFFDKNKTLLQSYYCQYCAKSTN